MWNFSSRLGNVVPVWKHRRILSDLRFFLGCFCASYVFCNYSVRAHIPIFATPYSGYPLGSEHLGDVGKLYKRALDHVYEDDWGVVEYTIMAKHFERQGQPAYAYHANYLAHLLSEGEAKSM